MAFLSQSVPLVVPSCPILDSAPQRRPSPSGSHEDNKRVFDESTCTVVYIKHCMSTRLMQKYKMYAKV
jgi:hypothetical protein